MFPWSVDIRNIKFHIYRTQLLLQVQSWHEEWWKQFHSVTRATGGTRSPRETTLITGIPPHFHPSSHGMGTLGFWIHGSENGNTDVFHPLTFFQAWRQLSSQAFLQSIADETRMSIARWFAPRCGKMSCVSGALWWYSLGIVCVLWLSKEIQATSIFDDLVLLKL